MRAAVATVLFAALVAGTGSTLADSPPPDMIPPGLGKPPPPIVDPFAAPPGSIHPSPGKVPGATQDDAALEATTAKFNAYVGLMNRTLRAIDSLSRYESWVNMRTGPTGRERYVYGLYDVYDTHDEAAAAAAETSRKPLLPDLDDAVRAYIVANDRLGPILNKATGYYDRGDYKLDHFARGKALHVEIVDAAGPFLAARAHLEAVMRVEKHALDEIRLATIEKNEGRNTHWQISKVMLHAKATIDALHAGGRTVDMQAFDAALASFGAAVTDMDDYAAAHRNSFSGFEPDDLLAKLREMRAHLVRMHGDLRRATDPTFDWITNDYNTMVTMSETAAQLDYR